MVSLTTVFNHLNASLESYPEIIQKVHKCKTITDNVKYTIAENTPGWKKADASVKLMKTISVGNGGIWACNAKDERSLICVSVYNFSTK